VSGSFLAGFEPGEAAAVAVVVVVVVVVVEMKGAG
jgi:hypothetical protein